MSLQSDHRKGKKLVLLIEEEIKVDSLLLLLSTASMELISANLAGVCA